MRLILIIFTAFILFSCDKNAKNFALGVLERERISLTATTNEVVTNLPVEKGSTVKKGTILVQLDTTLQSAQVAKAQADVEEAKSNLKKLENGARAEDIASAKAQVRSIKATLISSEAAYKRSKYLMTKNLGSQSALDKALAIRDYQRANLNNAQEQLKKLVKGTRLEDINLAQAHLDSNLALLTIEQKKLSNLTIKATRDGILDNLPWNLGERVTSGSPLAIVLAGSAPYARVYIPETYRVKVKLNNKLMVHIEGIEKPIEGTLSWISNEPAFSPYYALNQSERSRLMYLAEVQLPESADYLPSGVPVQVELP